MFSPNAVCGKVGGLDMSKVWDGDRQMRDAQRCRECGHYACWKIPEGDKEYVPGWYCTYCVPIK